VLWTSTIGVSPVTVIVSSIAPTRSSAFTDATNDPVSSMPSRLTVLKPGTVNVTAYRPGCRFSIRYWPLSSVTADRSFSISAGLAASTVTPGSTAPEVSRTAPAMDPCAYADAGASKATVSKTSRLACVPMMSLREQRRADVQAALQAMRHREHGGFYAYSGRVHYGRKSANARDSGVVESAP
jgi:hypothetical protein